MTDNLITGSHFDPNDEWSKPMTDKTEAPERMPETLIAWLSPLGKEMRGFWACGVVHTDVKASYTRTDLHQAELAAVLQKAAAKIRNEVFALPNGALMSRGYNRAVKDCLDAIIALTPSDATAALEAVKQKAWNEAMDDVRRIAIGIARSGWNVEREGAKAILEEIRALKREEK